MRIGKSDFYELVLKDLRSNFRENNSINSKVVGLLEDRDDDRFHTMEYEENVPVSDAELVMKVEDYEYLIAAFLAFVDDEAGSPRHLVIVEFMRSAHGDRDILGLMYLDMENELTLDKVEYHGVRYGMLEVNAQGALMETPGELQPLGPHPFA